MTVTLPPELLRCVTHGDSAATAALLMAMAAKERQALMPAFKMRVRSADFGPEVGPLLIAGATILSTPAQLAAWMSRAQLRFFRGPYEPIMSVLTSRDEAWLSELGTRLADALPADGTGHWYLASTLIGLTGAPVPTGEAFVREWTRRTFLGAQPLSAAVLRSDPFLTSLLPRVFEVDRLGLLLEQWNWKEHGDTSASSSIAAALVLLADEGTVSRAVLLDGTLGRLLRGDSPAALRPFVELHRQLRPSLDELAAHRIDYLQLLPDAPSFVAAMAQTALQTLDEAGRLSFDALADASTLVLGRTEKTLVRNQLTWLNRVLTRDPTRATEAVALVAIAAAHADLAIVERAQSMMDRYGSFSRLPVVEPAVPVVPLAAVPRSVQPPIQSSAELAAELVSLLDGAPPNAAIVWERVLDGIVRRAAEESPTEFALTLAPIAARQHAALRAQPAPHHGPEAHLRNTIIRLAGPPSPPADPIQVPPGHGLGRILTARVNEICRQLRRSPVPFLLATPTSVSGHLGPEILLQRMVELEARGIQPWPLDLDQALLRLPRDIDPGLVERAGRLASPAGALVRQWLAHNGMSDPPTRRIVVERQYEQWKMPAHLSVPLVKVDDAVHPTNAVAAASTGWHPYTSRFRWYPDRDLWPITVPSHREVVAAHLLPAIADAAQLDLSSCPRLTFLIDGTGPTGPATALALTYGLAAKAVNARASTIDTVLHLSAVDEIDAAAIGAEVGTLGANGELKLNRITGALDEVSRSGAATTAWRIARAALPALLGQPAPPRGAADLLQLAARTAAQLGIRSTVVGLEAAAARSGSSQFRTEARRLQRVLTAGQLT